METQITGVRTLLTKTDPVERVKLLFGIPEESLWDKAQVMIRSVYENRRTAVHAGHSVSKDWTAGVVALDWLIRYPGNSKVILTAPKMLQVKEIMLAEIKKQLRAFIERTPWPIAGDPMKSMKIEFGDEWYAIGMTTTETAGPEGGGIGKFQGFKSPNMLIIVSEAQSVRDNIYDQLEGMTTSGNSRVLEIGNPVAPSGRFWQHCTQLRFGYNVIHISCMESPNVIAGREIVPGMVTKEWVEERRREWGEGHPYWTSRVMGQFPQSGADCIIPIEWIMAAVNRHLPDSVNYDERFVAENDDLRVGGCDVSKGGSAETVHQELEGRIALPAQGFFKVDINETVGWAKNLIKSRGLKLYAVDEGGLAGIAGFLDEEGLPAMRIFFGGAVEEDSDFDNLGAKMYWELRKAFAPGSNNPISIPDDPILIGQLSARRFGYTSRGKRLIKLEEKGVNAQAAKTTFDRSDALAEAWWARTRLVGAGELMIGSGKAQADELQQIIERKRDFSGPRAEATEIRY